MTLDGKTAVASGESQWISSPGSRASSSTSSGAGWGRDPGGDLETVLADDPQLTCGQPAPEPRSGSFDSKALLPLNSRLVHIAMKSSSRRRLAASPGRPPPCPRGTGLRGRRLPCADPRANHGAAGRTRSAPMTNLLVEGGGGVLGSFLEARQVDEVEADIARHLEGGDHPHTPARGQGLLRMGDAALTPKCGVQRGRR